MAAIWAADGFAHHLVFDLELLAALRAESLESHLRLRQHASRIDAILYSSELRAEELHLQDGWTYEPPTFFETNLDDGPETAVRVSGIAACGPKAHTQEANARSNLAIDIVPTPLPFRGKAPSSQASTSAPVIPRDQDDCEILWS